MSKTLRSLLIATAMVAVAPQAAFAELKSEMSAFVVTTDTQGQEQFQPAYTVKPGQVIEYRLSHTNTFDNAIGGVSIVGPVPAEAVVEANSATSTADAVFEVRADLDPDNPGEEWSTLPAMREVIREDGTRILEEAGPDLFTAVRWRIQPALASQEAVQNSYRVRVR